MTIPELPGGWAPEAVLTSRPDRLVVRARRPAGAPIVVKATVEGAGWTARAALRAEARLLDRARGPGVVEVLDVLDGRWGTALLLAFVPAGTLLERAPPDPRLLAVTLRSTVGRLHDLDVVHGALRKEHVALTADGDPVLLGFGTARRHGDPHRDIAALAQLEETLDERPPA